MRKRKAVYSKGIRDPAVFNEQLTQRLAEVLKEQQRQEMHLQERHRQVDNTPERKEVYSKDIDDPAVFNEQLTQRLEGVLEEQQRQEMYLQERHRQVHDTRILSPRHQQVLHLQLRPGLLPAPDSQVGASTAAVQQTASIGVAHERGQGRGPIYGQGQPRGVPQAASTGVAHGGGRVRGHIHGQGQPQAHTHYQARFHVQSQRYTQGQGRPQTHGPARIHIHQTQQHFGGRPTNKIHDAIDNCSDFTFFSKSQKLNKCRWY
jgi:hypothetical protein